MIRHNGTKKLFRYRFQNENIWTDDPFLAHCATSHLVAALHAIDCNLSGISVEPFPMPNQ